MTAAERAARKAGESWGVSLARAFRSGPQTTYDEYCRRFSADWFALPYELRGAFDAGYRTEWSAAYAAEWARLEGETE